MKVTNKITIHLDDDRRLPPVDVMQGDANTRVLELTLLASNAPWNVPADVSLAVAYRRPDGSRGLYDTLPDGTAACTVAGNVVTAILAPQALACAGITEVTVVLANNGNQLATFCVMLRVERNPAIGAVKPEDYVNMLGAGSLVITVTGSETDGYTADKSIGDIQDADEQGKTVWCRWNGYYLPMVKVGGAVAYFATVLDGQEVQIQLGDGGVTVTTQELGADVWVTVTGDGAGGYTSDMPHAQILEAVNAGKTVWCRYLDYALPLALIDADEAAFETTYNGHMVGACVWADGAVQVAVQKLATEQSIPPKAMTVHIMPVDEEQGTATADKTYQEIVAAYAKGQDIRALDGSNGILIPMVNPPNGDEVAFCLTEIFSGESLNVYVEIRADDSCEYRVEIAGIPTRVSQLENDSGFLTSAPVTSVNGQTGAVNITIPAVPTQLPSPGKLTFTGAVSAEYDGSGDLEVAVPAAVTDAHIDSRIDEKLTSGGVETVPGYVRAEAERVARLVQSRQSADTCTIILGSDIHARLGLTSGGQLSSRMLESALHAAQAMQIVAQRVQVDLAGLLGDYLWDSGETADQAMELYRTVWSYFSPAFGSVPQLWAKGNHDMLGNSASGVELTDSQIFAGIGIHNTGAVFDGANKVLGYCYRDLEAHKLRIVCMNTNETRSSHAVGAAQLAWLQTALDMPAGWKAIILSHCPLDWWGTGSAVYQTVSGFADKILCNLHGHTHNYITGTVGDTGIPRVAIPNIDFYRANTYADNAIFGEAVTYPKEAGSAADTAFCVITIDRAANKLYADHYGAGYDREVDLATGGSTGGEEGVSYTNRIPLSTATFGGSTIFGEDYDGDGVADGYKVGTRINSSSNEVAVSGMCCTGFIPVSAGDTLRIKNVTLSGSATSYLMTFTTTGGAKSSLSVDAQPDENGVYTYTIPEHVGAVRLSVGVIDGTSIVTVNEPIE